ncbi:MAG: hypothetical protein A2046_11045 [Bacteroidetes bacterium GWA2_30_7]|nr:MAG: hypothetical protein A2046_11045 [Bacteroidetes bacterium GWA2_30_7]
MLNNFKLTLFFFLTILSISVFSQNITLNAEIDTNAILIGDHFNMKITLSQPSNIKIDFPIFTDTIPNSVEILSASKIDTVVTNGILNLKQNLVLTSFDSGPHEILPLDFVIHIDTITDTIRTRQMFYQVFTIPPDTAVQDIKDIKPPFEAPISFREYLPYILLGLGIIALIIAIWWYLKKRKKNEPITRIIQKPKEPAHIIAFRELDELKEKKLWQQGKIKEYHTEVTEIIRKYIEFRFNVMALEQTSDEILSTFRNSNLCEAENLGLLNQMFSLADLVKFAKANPLPDEHDSSMRNAYSFVSNTKTELKSDNQQNTTEVNSETK